MAVYKNLAVIGLQWVQKQTLAWILLPSRQSSIFYYHIFSTQYDKICCAVKYLTFPQKIKLSVFSIQGPLHSNKIM